MDSPAKTIHVSLTGSDSGKGTEGSPFASLQKAISMAHPGDTILLEPGRYTNPGMTGAAVKIANLSGTADAPITIKGNGGLAVIDASPNTASWGSYALDVKNSSHLVFDSIGFTGAKQSVEGSWAVGANVIDSSNITFLGCSFYENQGVGLLISGKSGNNQIVSCDAYGNYDPRSSVDGGNADGFQLSGTASGYPGNTLVDCRAWNNSDDGFDLYNANSPVTVTGCEAWHNGYIPGTGTPSGGDGDGFKLGKSTVTVSHTVENSIAHDNRVYGFDSNGVKGPLILKGNTAYGNGENYYLDDDVAHQLTGNVSQGGKAPDVLGDASLSAGNSWADSGAAVPGGGASSPAPSPSTPGLTLTGTGYADHLAGGMGSDTLRGNGGNDILKGADGADRLEGGSGADWLYGETGADKLFGGSGNDVLVGGAGCDEMTGGGGADRFVFLSLGDMGVGSAADCILDFKAKAGDTIDLSAIDAVSTKAGNQSFTFVSGLSGNAGDLFFDTKNNILSGDTDGDGHMNFEIALKGVHALSSDSLLL